MSIDKDNRKSFNWNKQIEEDPWNSLEDAFPVGGVRRCSYAAKMIRRISTIAIRVRKGFAPAKHLRKDDKMINIDDIEQFHSSGVTTIGVLLVRWREEQARAEERMQK